MERLPAAFADHDLAEGVRRQDFETCLHVLTLAETRLVAVCEDIAQQIASAKPDNPSFASTRHQQLQADVAHLLGRAKQAPTRVRSGLVGVSNRLTACRSKVVVWAMDIEIAGIDGWLADYTARLQGKGPGPRFRQMAFHDSLAQAIEQAADAEKQASIASREFSEFVIVSLAELEGFRAGHLSVTWQEALSRARKAVADGLQGEAEDKALGALKEELVAVLGEEFRELLQFERLRRWGGALAKVAGRREISTTPNWTDLLMHLGDALDRAEVELADAEKVAREAERRIDALSEIRDDPTDPTNLSSD